MRACSWTGCLVTSVVKLDGCARRQQAVLGRDRWDSDALRALAAGVPFRWVATDSVYGVGDIERDLRQAAKCYVLGVNSNHWFASWGKPQWVAGTAEEIAKTQRRSDWRRLSAGAGTKGPRLHDWCYLELADLEGEDSNHHSQVLWTRGLLIRRNIANGDLAYFTT